ncbi:MAG: hypothetical protein ACLFWL_17910 [Candidatus Brocadiia bacterium]
MCGDSSAAQWNCKKIVEHIQRLEDRGDELSYNRVAEELPDLLSAANYHFGSWKDAVEAAGLDYEGEVRRIPKWTKEVVVEVVQEAYEKGVDLSWTNVSGDPEYSGVAYAAIRSSRFGSWDATLRAAGVDPSEVRRYESWNREKVLRRIRERKRKGLPLNSKAMQEDDCRLFNAALKRFQGWDKALEAAGVDPDEVYKRRRWSKQIIKKEIKNLGKEGEKLAAPAMRKQHSALYSAAVKYFGSWAQARRAAGIGRDFQRNSEDSSE